MVINERSPLVCHETNFLMYLIDEIKVLARANDGLNNCQLHYFNFLYYLWLHILNIYYWKF